MTRLGSGLCLIAVLVLGGCACTQPSLEARQAADYGGAIDQEDAEYLAKQYMAGILKDPYTAKYRFQSVYKGYLQKAPIHGCGVSYGYVLEFGVNAKNSYGGYTGEKPYAVLFKDGVVVDIHIPLSTR